MSWLRWCESDFLAKPHGEMVERHVDQFGHGSHVLLRGQLVGILQSLNEMLYCFLLPFRDSDQVRGRAAHTLLDSSPGARTAFS